MVIAEADQQLGVTLLEPLLDHQAVGKARAHRAERGNGEGFGDGGFRRDEAGVIHPFDGDQVAFRSHHSDRNGHAHGASLFDHGVDEFAALRRP
jgi:hypothetical protein